MEIGDRVEVTKPGLVYTSYREMFVKMGFKNKKQNFTSNVNLNAVYKIFAIEPHLIFPYQLLYGIENEQGEQLLVNGLAIKTIERPNWKKPQKVKFDGEQTFWIQTTGAHDKHSFEGIVYESRSSTVKEGYYSKNWNKKEFYKA